MFNTVVAVVFSKKLGLTDKKKDTMDKLGPKISQKKVTKPGREWRPGFVFRGGMCAGF